LAHTKEANKMVDAQSTLSSVRKKMALLKLHDNGGRAGRDGISNLRILSKKKNVGLENKRRAKKK